MNTTVTMSGPAVALIGVSLIAAALLMSAILTLCAYQRRRYRLLASELASYQRAHFDASKRLQKVNEDYYDLLTRQPPAFDEDDRLILEDALEWFTKTADPSDLDGALSIRGDWRDEPQVHIEYENATVTLRASVEYLDTEEGDEEIEAGLEDEADEASEPVESEATA